MSKSSQHERHIYISEGRRDPGQQEHVKLLRVVWFRHDGGKVIWEGQLGKGRPRESEPGRAK